MICLKHKITYCQLHLKLLKFSLKINSNFKNRKNSILTWIVVLPKWLFEFEHYLVDRPEVNGFDGRNVFRGKGRRKKIEMTIFQITERS